MCQFTCGWAGSFIRSLATRCGVWNTSVCSDTLLKVRFPFHFATKGEGAAPRKPSRLCSPWPQGVGHTSSSPQQIRAAALATQNSRNIHLQQSTHHKPALSILRSPWAKGHFTMCNKKKFGRDLMSRIGVRAPGFLFPALTEIWDVP